MNNALIWASIITSALALIGVAVGLATVWLTYRLGSDLYGRRAGLIAALFMAVMPYHVVVTRQVLLDGPMALCATAALAATWSLLLTVV